LEEGLLILERAIDETASRTGSFASGSY